VSGIQITGALVKLCNEICTDKDYRDLLFSVTKVLMENGVPDDAIGKDLLEKCNANKEEFEALKIALGDYCENVAARKTLVTLFAGNPENCANLCKLAKDNRLTLSEVFINLYNNADDDGTREAYTTAAKALKDSGVPGNALTKELLEKHAANKEEFDTLCSAVGLCRGDAKPEDKTKAKAALIEFFTTNPEGCMELCKLAEEMYLTLSLSFINSYQESNAAERKELLVKEALTQMRIPSEAMTKDLVGRCTENPKGFKALHTALKSYCASNFYDGVSPKVALVTFFAKNPKNCALLCELAQKEHLIMTKNLIDSCANASPDKYPQYVEFVKRLFEKGALSSAISEELLEELSNDDKKLQKALKFLNDAGPAIEYTEASEILEYINAPAEPPPEPEGEPEPSPEEPT
jgi:hypothetical protein